MKTNNTMGIVRTARWALGVAVLLCGGVVQAAGVELENAVYQEIATKAADGTVQTTLVPAERVVPGGEVVYEITYRNTSSDLATDIAIDNPLPAELVFIEAETPPAMVSVDGGASFGQLAELTVITAEGDVRAAVPADITNLRWTVETLAAGASGKIVYRARVK